MALADVPLAARVCDAALISDIGLRAWKVPSLKPLCSERYRVSVMLAVAVVGDRRRPHRSLSEGAAGRASRIGASERVSVGPRGVPEGLRACLPFSPRDRGGAMPAAMGHRAHGRPIPRIDMVLALDASLSMMPPRRPTGRADEAGVRRVDRCRRRPIGLIAFVDAATSLPR